MVRALLVLSVCVLGCSSGSSGVSADMAKADCRTFIDSYYCPKAVTCATITQADCMAAASTVADCSIVTGENRDPSTCFAELAAITCPIFWDGTTFHAPASCSHLFAHP